MPYTMTYSGYEYDEPETNNGEDEEMTEMSERLTWDEVADIYQKNYGGIPRTLPMKTVFNSVKKLPFIHMDEEGYLYRILDQKKESEK